MLPEELEKLHTLELAALLEVDRICRAHGIAYFISAGTLLGAIRHGGFIPWDDDLDVGMMREDYEKFLPLAQQKLLSGYFVQTHHTDGAYFLPYAKIRLNGTRFVEVNSRHSKMHQGVYIDIFPYDAIPDHRLARLLHKALLYMLKTAALARSDFSLDAKAPIIKRCLFKAIGLAANGFRLEGIVDHYETVMKMHNGKYTRCVANIAGSYGYRRQTMDRSYFTDTTEVVFEGETVLAPSLPHEYLTALYGDYSVLPPEDKRGSRHHVYELSL